jgi:hypothetical protein
MTNKVARWCELSACMQVSWQYPHVHQHVVWQVEQKIPGWKSNLVFCLARRGKAALCCPRAPIAGGKKTAGREVPVVDESDVGLKSSSWWIRLTKIVGHGGRDGSCWQGHDGGLTAWNCRDEWRGHLVLKIWPVVNGLIYDPYDLVRHEYNPARQVTGSARPEARVGLCLGLAGSPLDGHDTTRLARPDQAWW